jgi:hypothetical protein
LRSEVSHSPLDSCIRIPLLHPASGRNSASRIHLIPHHCPRPFPRMELPRSSAAPRLASTRSVDQKGSSIVMDFGIARAAETEHFTQTGATIGTPAYMSHEQCHGSELSLELSGAVMRMLLKDPAERWPSLRELVPIFSRGLEALGEEPRDELVAMVKSGPPRWKSFPATPLSPMPAGAHHPRRPLRRPSRAFQETRRPPASVPRAGLRARKVTPRGDTRRRGAADPDVAKARATVGDEESRQCERAQGPVSRPDPVPFRCCSER